MRFEAEAGVGAAAVVWGVTRADRRRWHAPPGQGGGGAPGRGAPEGSTRSPLVPVGGPEGPVSLDLELPEGLAPATLAFALEPAAAEGGGLLGPADAGAGAFFTLPLGVLPGIPAPLGPSPGPGGGLNIAVVAPAGSSGARMRLARTGTPASAASVELELDPRHHKTGDVWHVLLPAPGEGGAPFRYSFTFLSDVGGEASVSSGWRPDPLAPLLCPSGMSTYLWDSDGSAGPLEAACGGGRSLEDLVVCDLDCRDLAMGKDAGGTLSALRDSGFTAVALRGALAPGSLVAVSSEVGGGTGEAEVDGEAGPAVQDLYRAREALRDLVRGADEAGLEVLLIIDSADAAAAIAGVRHPGPAAAGPGAWAGVLADPRSVELISLALAKLSGSLCVSGFLFEGAEALCGGSLPELLAADPGLRHLKLVASVHSREDLLRHLPASAQRPVFPHWGAWAEVCWSFPQHLCAFLAAPAHAGASVTPGLGELATRLAGSADFFQEWHGGAPATHMGRRPAFCFSPVQLPGEGPGEELRRSLTVQLAAAIAPGVPFVSGWLFAPSTARRLLETLLSIRAQYAHILQPPSFQAPRDIRWHASGGGEPVWDSAAGRGEPADGGAPGAGDSDGRVPSSPERFLGLSIWSSDGTGALYVAFNGDEKAVHAVPPSTPPGHRWVLRADTAEALPLRDTALPAAPGAAVPVLPGSGILLELCVAVPENLTKI